MNVLHFLLINTAARKWVTVKELICASRALLWTVQDFHWSEKVTFFEAVFMNKSFAVSGEETFVLKNEEFSMFSFAKVLEFIFDKYDSRSKNMWDYRRRKLEMDLKLDNFQSVVELGRTLTLGCAVDGARVRKWVNAVSFFPRWRVMNCVYAGAGPSPEALVHGQV
jgi:hypothetical protein